jgi:hypothetical protein
MSKYKINFTFFLSVFLIFLFFLISKNFFLFYTSRFFDGCDMMWSPSALFLKNLNVFEIYFSNLRNTEIHCSNYPSYSISNIFFMIPFGFFDLNIAKKLWLAFNLFLLLNIYLIYKKYFLLKSSLYNILFVIFLISKPTILTLSIGQYGILVLWSFTLIIFNEKNKFLKFFAYLVSGLKYTFFPIIFYYSIYKKYLLFIFLFITINFLALVIFTLKFNGSLVNNFMLPFVVGSEQGGGGGDLMSILGNHPPPPFNYLLTIIISFIYFLIFFKKTIKNNKNHLIFISLITITIFRHHIYDAIFLLPFLLYLINSKNYLKYPCLAIIFYFWFIYHSNFLEHGGILPIMYTKGFRIFNFILLNVLLLYFFIDNIKSNQIFLKIKLNKVKKLFDQYEFKNKN